MDICYRFRLQFTDFRGILGRWRVLCEIKWEDKRNRRKINKGTKTLSGLLILICLSPTLNDHKQKHTVSVSLPFHWDNTQNSSSSWTQAEQEEEKSPVSSLSAPSLEGGKAVMEPLRCAASTHRCQVGTFNSNKKELKWAALQQSSLWEFFWIQIL